MKKSNVNSFSYCCNYNLIKILKEYFLEDFELEKLGDEFAKTQKLYHMHEKALNVLTKIVSQKREDTAVDSNEFKIFFNIDL